MAGAWATSIAVAVFCSTLLVANRIDDNDSLRSSTVAGLESTGWETLQGVGHAQVEQGRTPHNLYRFSGARAAVASMAHGF